MSSPAVNDLKYVLSTFGPRLLREGYFERSNPKQRLSRLQGPGGSHKSTGDIHNTGRALDIILFSTRARPGAEAEQEIADRLVQIFLDLRPEMRWSSVIYNRQEWNFQGVLQQPPRVMTEERRRKILADRAKKAASEGHPGVFKKEIDAAGFEHITHIHIDWDKDNANRATFRPALQAKVADLAYELDFGRASAGP